MYIIKQKHLKIPTSALLKTNGSPRPTLLLCCCGGHYWPAKSNWKTKVVCRLWMRLTLPPPMSYTGSLSVFLFLNALVYRRVKFGNYNETYGSLGAVVVLQLWLYVSAFVVLLGAQLNREAERQTSADTQIDEPPAQ